MIRHFFRTFLNKARDLFSKRHPPMEYGTVKNVRFIQADSIIVRAHRVRVPKVLRRIRTMQGKTTGDYNA
ncbi:MAG: hypothetical protein KGJ13_06430 [Patescibacteria group bacterium]|nr:hypothetical protein [Patescibacteria group bacterium]